MKEHDLSGIKHFSKKAFVDFKTVVRNYLVAIQFLNHRGEIVNGSIIYELLIEPIMGFIENHEVVVIHDSYSSDITLETVPVGLNLDGSPIYLIEKCTITNTFNLAADSYNNSCNYVSTFLGVSIMDSLSHSKDEANSLNEIIAIDSLIRREGFTSNILLINSEKARFFDCSNNPIRVMHWSSHFEKNEFSRNLNKLSVKSSNNYLYTETFQFLPNSFELVAFSSCNSLNLISSNDLYSFDEGQINTIPITKYIIVPLWKIYTPFAKYFYLRFYSTLIGQNFDYAKSLRETKLSFIHSGVYSHPLFWGGIQLFKQYLPL